MFWKNPWKIWEGIPLFQQDYTKRPSSIFYMTKASNNLISCKKKSKQKLIWRVLHKVNSILVPNYCSSFDKIREINQIVLIYKSKVEKGNKRKS